MGDIRHWTKSISNVFQGSRLRRRRGPSHFAAAEALEQRVLLTTFTVNTDSDDPNDGLTLREAIQQSNADAAVEDRIRFADSLAGERINLDTTLGELLITDGVTINAHDLDIKINAGDTSRIFHIDTSELVVLRNLTLEDGFTTDSGGAVLVAGGGQTNIIGGEIVDSGANGGGGAIFNSEGSTVVIRDSLFEENDTGGRGGAILNGAGGELRIFDTGILNNFAVVSGGGIEDQSDNGRGVLLQSVGLVDNSTDGNGGGLHVTGSGDVDIFYGQISDNTAASGGGVWNGTGTMAFTDIFIGSNTADGNDAGDGGGGIYNNGGVVVVSETSFSDNHADGDFGSGGGILSVGGDVVVRFSTFFHNDAILSGGGISITSGSLLLDTSFLEHNQAGPHGGPLLGGTPANGGGLYLGGAGIVANVRGTTFNENTADGSGGGIYNGGGALFVTRATLTSNHAEGDAANQGGGGLFNAGGNVYVLQSYIADNRADGDLGSGGGIFTTAGTFVVHQSTISGNAASRAGGGVEVVGGTFGIGASGLLQNVAGYTNPNAPGNGGGLHVSGVNANVTVAESIIRENIAEGSGGGLWNQQGSRMVVLNSDISENLSFLSSDGNGGGGLYNNGGELVVVYTTFDGNKAASQGGGLYLGQGGDVELSHVKITDGVAAGTGGGIRNDADLLLERTFVTNNSAGLGGGVYTNLNALTDLDWSSIVNNDPDNLAGPGVVV